MLSFREIHIIKKPFFTSIGIDIIHKGSQVTLRAILLSGIFDLPAKCIIQETIQFNGEFGCSFCEDPGEGLKTKKGGNVRVFPLKNVCHDATLRTEERVKAQAMIALENNTVVNMSPFLLDLFLYIKT